MRHIRFENILQRIWKHFSFFRYYAREDAEIAMRYINGTRLDERLIRTDWDAGFKEGRQFGRGKHGGQVPPTPSNVRQ